MYAVVATQEWRRQWCLFHSRFRRSSMTTSAPQPAAKADPSMYWHATDVALCGWENRTKVVMAAH